MINRKPFLIFLIFAKSPPNRFYRPMLKNRRWDLKTHGLAEGTLYNRICREPQNRKQKNSGRTILPISHEDLAQMAAMSRPHVSVTMGKLRKRCLVSYDRNNPLTIDVEKLKKYLTGIS